MLGLKRARRDRLSRFVSEIEMAAWTSTSDPEKVIRTLGGSGFRRGSNSLDNRRLQSSTVAAEECISPG
jgi:hypothetical protein